jgi:PKD repeat protein
MVIEDEKGFNSYKWQDGSTNPSFTVDSTGFYSVIITDYDLNCPATDTIHVEVIMPKLEFKPDFSVVTIEHPEIKFTNLTKDALTYSWDFGDGQSSTEMNPTHRYSEIKKYRVVLTAVSEFNCTDQVDMEVEVIPFNFFIPNAFRPESNIPGNRVFQPILNAVDPDNYQFQVFNRIGSTVFETRNPETGWTGNNSEQGVYVWIIKYLDIQGYEHMQKGTVMLVR